MSDHSKHCIKVLWGDKYACDCHMAELKAKDKRIAELEADAKLYDAAVKRLDRDNKMLYAENERLNNNNNKDNNNERTPCPIKRD